jgi:hypothetical protein
VIRDKRNLTAIRKTATTRMRNAAADKSVIVSANAKIKSVRSKLTVKMRTKAERREPLRFVCAQTLVSAPSPTTVIHSRTRQAVTVPLAT